jgi:hypothetical protein
MGLATAACNGASSGPPAGDAGPSALERDCGTEIVPLLDCPTTVVADAGPPTYQQALAGPFQCGSRVVGSDCGSYRVVSVSRTYRDPAASYFYSPAGDRLVAVVVLIDASPLMCVAGPATFLEPCTDGCTVLDSVPIPTCQDCKCPAGDAGGTCVCSGPTGLTMPTCPARDPTPIPCTLSAECMGCANGAGFTCRCADGASLPGGGASDAGASPEWVCASTEYACTGGY